MFLSVNADRAWMCRITGVCKCVRLGLTNSQVNEDSGLHTRNGGVVVFIQTSTY